MKQIIVILLMSSLISSECLSLARVKRYIVGIPKEELLKLDLPELAVQETERSNSAYMATGLACVGAAGFFFLLGGPTTIAIAGNLVISKGIALTGAALTVVVNAPVAYQRSEEVFDHVAVRKQKERDREDLKHFSTPIKEQVTAERAETKIDIQVSASNDKRSHEGSSDTVREIESKLAQGVEEERKSNTQTEQLSVQATHEVQSQVNELKTGTDLLMAAVGTAKSGVHDAKRQVDQQEQITEESANRTEQKAIALAIEVKERDAKIRNRTDDMLPVMDHVTEESKQAVNARAEAADNNDRLATANQRTAHTMGEGLDGILAEEVRQGGEIQQASAVATNVNAQLGQMVERLSKASPEERRAARARMAQFLKSTRFAQ